MARPPRGDLLRLVLEVHRLAGGETFLPSTLRSTHHCQSDSGGPRSGLDHGVAWFELAAVLGIPDDGVGQAGVTRRPRGLGNHGQL